MNKKNIFFLNFKYNKILTNFILFNVFISKILVLDLMIIYN